MTGIDANARRGLATAGIAVVVVLAIWGIIEVQNGDDQFGAPLLVGRLILIGILAALMSLVIGVGLRLAKRQPDLALVGYLSALTAVFGFALATQSIAREVDFLYHVNHFELAVLVTALALGQVSLLLSWPSLGDRGPAMIVAILASLVVVAAGVTVMIEVSKDGSDVSPRLYGTLAVLFLLGHVLTPLTAVAASESRSGPVDDEAPSRR